MAFILFCITKYSFLLVFIIIPMFIFHVLYTVFLRYYNRLLRFDFLLCQIDDSADISLVLTFFDFFLLMFPYLTINFY